MIGYLDRIITHPF